MSETTVVEPTESAQLEEKLKRFQEEEMERARVAAELLLQQQELEKQKPQESGEETKKMADIPPKVQDKRKKNLVFDEEKFEETFLKCLICRENFDLDEKLPKMLPCHHTFCLDCLRQMWRVEGEFRQTLTSAFRGMPMAVKIQCPTCRDGIITSEAEVRRLPNDHTIMELLSFMKDTGRCDVQYCSKHLMQPLNFFCEPCITPVCCDCTVIDHKESKGHVVVNVNEAVDKYTPILEATIGEVTTETSSLSEKKDSLVESANKLEGMKLSVAKQIHETFNRLRETIDERERELFEMTEREIARKKDSIEENLKLVVDRNDSLQKELRRLNNAKAEKDIICMFSGHKAAKEVLSQKVDVQTDCAENFDVEYNCSDKNERTIRENIANLADIVFMD